MYSLQLPKNLRIASRLSQKEGLFTDDTPALYGNYVNARTLVDIYGENLSRLRALRAEVDPENVMGLTGGFKF